MFYTHPFGGLISIFTPTVYEGQLSLTLDMQIDPFFISVIPKYLFQFKAKGHKDGS